MRERALIDAIAAATAPRSSRIVRWIGDDAAVVRADGACATSIDTVVDGVHFELGPLSPADVGHRALAAALSDLAAMGASAGEAYMALVLPPGFGDDEALALVGGAEALAAETGTTIAGGDICAGPALVVTVAVVGWAAAPEAFVGRDGAQRGDLVGVTGALGGSGAGLALAQGRASAPPAVAGALIERHRRPRPRLEAGLALAAEGSRAMIDVSDGIATDAGHIGRRSKALLAIDLDALPLAPGLESVAASLARDPREFAATAGEDFELCVCVPPARVDAVAAAVADITWIGEVLAPSARQIAGARMLLDGEPRDLRGYEH